MCIKSHRFLCYPYRSWEFHDGIKYQCPGVTVPKCRRFWRALICICVHVNRLLRIWNLLSKARTRAIRQLNFGHSRCILWQYISSMWVIFTRLLFLQQCFHSWKFDFIDLSAPSFALSPDTLWYFGMAIMRNITQSCSNEKTPLFFFSLLSVFGNSKKIDQTLCPNLPKKLCTKQKMRKKQHSYK